MTENDSDASWSKAAFLHAVFAAFALAGLPTPVTASAAVAPQREMGQPASRPASRPSSQGGEQESARRTFSQSEKKQAAAAKRAARTFRRSEVPGSDVEQRVERVRDSLRWHSKLSAALQSGRTSGKPVLWIQALGDLDGFL